MKFLLIIMLFLNSICNANYLWQKESLIESMPKYSGGIEELQKYFRSSIEYPHSAKEKRIMGKPLVRFIIDSLGNTLNPKIIISSENSLLDSEAIRVIKAIPKKWIPATKN